MQGRLVYAVSSPRWQLVNFKLLFLEIVLSSIAAGDNYNCYFEGLSKCITGRKFVRLSRCRGF